MLVVIWRWELNLGPFWFTVISHKCGTEGNFLSPANDVCEGYVCLSTKRGGYLPLVRGGVCHPPPPRADTRLPSACWDTTPPTRPVCAGIRAVRIPLEFILVCSSLRKPLLTTLPIWCNYVKTRLMTLGECSQHTHRICDSIIDQLNLLLIHFTK